MPKSLKKEIEDTKKELHAALIVRKKAMNAALLIRRKLKILMEMDKADENQNHERN